MTPLWKGCSLRPHHRNWCFNSFAFPKLLSMFPSLMWVCVSRCRLWLTLSVGVRFILHPYLYYCVCLRGFGEYSLFCLCVSVFIHFPYVCACLHATLSKRISIFMTSHVPRNMLWSCVAPVWQLTPRQSTRGWWWRGSHSRSHAQMPTLTGGNQMRSRRRPLIFISPYSSVLRWSVPRYLLLHNLKSEMWFTNGLKRIVLNSNSVSLHL